MTNKPQLTNLQTCLVSKIKSYLGKLFRIETEKLYTTLKYYLKNIITIAEEDLNRIFYNLVSSKCCPIRYEKKDLQNNILKTVITITWIKHI